MPPKILITATELHLLQFWTEHINAFINEGYSVDLICSDVGGKLENLRSRLAQCGNPHLKVVDLCRSPLSPKNLKGFYRLKRHFAENRYDAVLTNEPVMGMMTRLAAKSARKNTAPRLSIWCTASIFGKARPR